MLDSSYLLVCAVAFAAMFGGGMIGIVAARALPEHHLSNDSAMVVKLAAAVVVSLTSLVLALMLSSANSSYSANAGIVKKLSSDLIHLDHLLRVYGPDANAARADLRAYATKKNDELFGVSKAPATNNKDTTKTDTANRETADLLDALLDAIVSLSPADRRQTALVSQAQFLIDNVYAERWLLWENPGSTVPAQFLFVLIFWLGLIYVSFGLFAPANLTVIASFFLSALAVAGAVILILELGDPVHHGWFQVSSEPMHRAMIEIDRP